jgi:hypothetical protein
MQTTGMLDDTRNAVALSLREAMIRDPSPPSGAVPMLSTPHANLIADGY